MTIATANAAAHYPTPDIDTAIARALAAANDRPDPEFDDGCSAQKYAGMAQEFRAGAWKHLDEGDLAQASNKAWGLVAETVKAISAHHGRIIHSHRAIWQVVHELARLVGDAGDLETRRWITNSFRVARSLRSNFHEDRDPEYDVLAGLILCEELSRRLYQLFWPAGHSPQPPTQNAAAAPQKTPHPDGKAIAYGKLRCSV